MGRKVVLWIPLVVLGVFLITTSAYSQPATPKLAAKQVVVHGIAAGDVGCDLFVGRGAHWYGSNAQIGQQQMVFRA